eukprot:gene9048-9218_t
MSEAQAVSSRALYHCNYCHKDISNNVRIKCADCPDFDLCVECFSVGVEVMGHSNTHSYRVMDNLSFPIYHPSWGSDEELLLLEAVDIYGPGSWAAVAEHVGTKSKAACKEHYFQIYIEPGSCPLPTPAPEMAGGLLTARAANTQVAGGAALLGAGLGLGPGSVGPAGGGGGGGAEPPRVRGSGPQLDMMTEWDNEAEQAIADLEFKDDDSPEEVAGKLRMLDIYNKRLDEVILVWGVPWCRGKHLQLSHCHF